MKKWKCRISDRLSFDVEDAKKSEKIVSELAALLKELPNIEKHEEQVKEKKYWELFELKRKSDILNYPDARKKEIQSRLWQCEREISAPRKELNEKNQRLQFELQALINPFKSEIVEILDRHIGEVRALRMTRVIGRESRFLDLGNRGEKNVWMRITEDNFSACDKITNLLISFKSTVRGLNGISLSEIIKMVEEFEKSINAIDSVRMERSEVRENEWLETRQPAI